MGTLVCQSPLSEVKDRRNKCTALARGYCESVLRDYSTGNHGNFHCESTRTQEIMKQFYPDGSGLFQDNSTPIHRAPRLTKWFDEDVNHIYGLHKSSLSTTTIKSPTERISFGKIVFTSPLQFQRFLVTYHGNSTTNVEHHNSILYVTYLNATKCNTLFRVKQHNVPQCNIV